VSTAPDISVVIATHDRERRLEQALAALAEQTLEAKRFEVVVVRSAETPQPWAGAPDGLNVRFLEHSGSAGPAAKRNVGWRAARGRVVAFTDDDCRPHPDWLARLLAAEAGEEVILQGATAPDPAEVEHLWGLARTIEIGGPTGEYETCNIAYPRSVLERVGGFDEEITASWTEDTDLGLRAAAAGAELRFVVDALVWHAVVPRTLADALRETRRYRWLVRLLARHPAYRRERFPARLIKPTHATVLLALAGLVLARRRPVPATLLVSPYLAAHLATHLETNSLGARSLARFGVHFPQQALVDLAEVAVVLAAAARERTLVV
jgi:GT2 family glycosyltransferase